MLARPIPNANVLHKLEIHKSEVAISSVVVHELLQQGTGNREQG